MVLKRLAWVISGLLFLASLVGLIDLPNQVEKWQAVFQRLGIRMPAIAFEYFVPITIISAFFVGIIILLFTPLQWLFKKLKPSEPTYTKPDFEPYEELLYAWYIRNDRVEAFGYPRCPEHRCEMVRRAELPRWGQIIFCPISGCTTTRNFSQDGLEAAKQAVENIVTARRQHG